MPSPKRFGTRSFGTLDVKKPPHALEDFELQVATNVDRSEAGVIMPAHNDLFQYTVQGVGNGLGVVTCSGVDYALYADDDYVWENGTSIGASGGDVTHRFLSDGYRRYVLNGVQNKVWDGTHYRKHGPLTGHDLSSTKVADKGCGIDIDTTDDDMAIVSATAATGYIVATGHGMVTGDNVYCTAFAGGTWTTLNGNVYVITRVDADTFTLDGVTTSGLGTCSGGTIRPKVVGVAGSYRYRASIVLTLTSGQEIETNLQEVSFETLNGADIEGYPKVYMLTKDMVVKIGAVEVTDAELEAYTSAVTAAAPSAALRVYRTKAGGEDFWLLGDADLRRTAYGIGLYHDQSADTDLTTAYLDGFSDHSTPPTASLGIFHQQRLFLASGANLYFSMVGKYDYFPPLNYITVVDQITALGKFGDSVVIFTPAGIKLYSPVGELGQLTDVQSSVGTTYPDSICHTGFGTLFCRKDGLWLFDGVSTTRISEPIDSLWKAASGTWRGAYVAGHGYFTCGDDSPAKALE